MTTEAVSSHPTPLTSQEVDRLRRWERRMIRSYATIIMVIAAGIGLSLVYGEAGEMRFLVLGAAALIAIGVAVAQFRERCPRCQTRLGSQSLLLLPDRCRTCGVAFPRPPRLDSELDN
jgi:hypothetical protein